MISDDDISLDDDNAVPSPPPDPARALQKSLTPRLDEDEDRELAHVILTDFEGGISDRGEWETRLVEWEDQYYNRVTDKTYPWEGASNFHVPITMMGVETYKPRLVEAVLGQNPPLIAVPTTAAGEDRKTVVETVLNWQIQSQLKLEPIVTQSAHLFLQPGLALAKVYWKVTRTWRKLIREFPTTTPMQDIFEALFGDKPPTNLESTGDMEWEGEIPTSPQGGMPLQVKIKMRVLDDGIQVLVEREVVDERPQVDLIDPIDIIVPVRGGQTFRELPWKQHRIWMNESDLRAKVAAGRFYQDVVQKMISEGEPTTDNPATDATMYRSSQDQAEGVTRDGESDVRNTQWAIIEDYRSYDIDDDGIDEEIIVWACQNSPDQILGWDYLDNVYAHGRCPLHVGRFFPVPFRWYGLSYAEMMKGIQDEINTIHNQKVDFATLQNLPFGFVRASATLPPIQQRIKPGEMIPIDNPAQDVNFPKWGGSPAWANQEEATLYQYGERLSGISDLTVGRQPNRVGATRTAKGTQTLLSEGGLRFKIAMQAFQRFWIGIFEDILALDQEYLPPNQEFRITGRRPAVIRVKDRTEIRGQYDIRLTTTTDNLNREQMRQDSTIVMQGMMNPAAIQAGIVGIKGIRQSYTDWLKSFGKDPAFYLEDQASIRNPVEELMLFNIDQYVSPVQGENFQMHIPAHQQALQDPSIRPEVKRMIQRHLQETYQLMQAQKMAMSMQTGGKAAPVGQQAENAQIGRQAQGPAGMNGAQPTPAGAGMPQPMGGNMNGPGR